MYLRVSRHESHPDSCILYIGRYLRYEQHSPQSLLQGIRHFRQASSTFILSSFWARGIGIPTDWTASSTTPALALRYPWQSSRQSGLSWLFLLQGLWLQQPLIPGYEFQPKEISMFIQSALLSHLTSLRKTVEERRVRPSDVRAR